MKVLAATLLVLIGLDGGQTHAAGKDVFERACATCHRAGINGAPVAGNRAAWEPRAKAGLQSLYKSALNGKNDMPPKGGKERLSVEEVMAAVDYLLVLAGFVADGDDLRAATETK